MEILTLFLVVFASMNFVVLLITLVWLLVEHSNKKK